MRIDRAFQNRAVQAGAIGSVPAAQLHGRVDQFRAAAGAGEPSNIFSQAVGLIGVVEDDDATRSRESHPVPDPEINADKNQCAAAWKIELERPDAPDALDASEKRRGLVFAPDPDLCDAIEHSRCREGTMIGASIRVPQRVDQMYERTLHETSRRPAGPLFGVASVANVA